MVNLKTKPAASPCRTSAAVQVSLYNSRQDCLPSLSTMPSDTAQDLEFLSQNSVLDTGLMPDEFFWRDHQPWLQERGYMLRPRYMPDWKPSWETSPKNRIFAEDALFHIVWSFRSSCLTQAHAVSGFRSHRCHPHSRWKNGLHKANIENKMSTGSRHRAILVVPTSVN